MHRRLHPFKGVEFLVDALPTLCKEVGPVQTILGGPRRATPRFGDYGMYLEQRAAELGVSEMIHMIGAVDPGQITPYWAAADIVLVVSVVESFNRVAAEAAAVGTPVIVTRTTGISEYVAQYDCGQIVEPQSGAAIATAAVQLLSDRNLWERQAGQGPRLAAQFRSPRIAEQLLAAYRGVVSTSTRKR